MLSAPLFDHDAARPPVHGSSTRCQHPDRRRTQAGVEVKDGHVLRGVSFILRDLVSPVTYGWSTCGH